MFIMSMGLKTGLKAGFKRCSVPLYLQLSYLRVFDYLRIVVSKAYCVVFFVFLFSIVHFWLTFQYSPILWLEIMTADILILLEENLISIIVIIFKELHNSLDNCFHNNGWQCIKQETVLRSTDSDWGIFKF
jgi:hypothetical protein